MNKSEKIAELRQRLARYDLPSGRPAVPLGHAAADAVLGGGLRAGLLHEVFARDWGGGGFALLLALRLAGAAANGRGGPLFWVRPDHVALEYGAVAPEGLAALGGDPNRLVVVRAPHPADALAAAVDILACPHVGCLLLEMEGNPPLLDLTAGRRLALAAEETGVGLILLREGARDDHGAAHTRWHARAAPSRLDDDDWGNPRFAVELVRHRMGGLGGFLMEWNNGLFHDPLPARRGGPAADPSPRHPLPAALRARERRA